jgi:hypothetical protein
MLRRDRNFFFCWFFSILAGIFVSSVAEAYQYSIPPSDDTYVSNFTGEASNYGVNYLYLANTPAFLAYAYLKFPLAQIRENEVVDNATLRLYNFSGYHSVITVSYVAFDDWTEETITWSDHPSDHAVPVLMDSKFLSYIYENIQFDLIKNISWPLPSDNEDNSLTLLVTLSSFGDAFLASTSNEGADNNWLPTLNITTHTMDSRVEISSVPLPSSLVLILSGLMAFRGSACLFRRKR